MIPVLAVYIAAVVIPEFTIVDTPTLIVTVVSDVEPIPTDTFPPIGSSGRG